MSDEKNVKFKCPYCKRIVFDTWISYLEHNGGVKCPMCKTGFSVSLRPTKPAPDAGDSAHTPNIFQRLISFLAGRLRRPSPQRR